LRAVRPVRRSLVDRRRLVLVMVGWVVLVVPVVLHGVLRSSSWIARPDGRAAS
jgi:hypothetical protein